MTKGIERIAHSVTLLTAEIQKLQRANKALSQHRRAKRNWVRQGGTLTVGNGQDILAQGEIGE